MNSSKLKKQKPSNSFHEDPPNKRFIPDDSSIQVSNTSIEESGSREDFAKENDEIIKVYVRVKPDLKSDGGINKIPTPELSLRFRNNQNIQIVNSSREVVKSFSFEHVLNENLKQEEVFMIAAAPIIKHAIMGYNSTIFVYGQTGTGKTHTMGLLNQINEESNGILPLSLKYLFEYFDEVKSREGDTFQWDLSVSLIQIYLDNIMDLLNPSGDSLAIREDPDTKETYLQDLTTVPVKNLQQAMVLINAGLVARAQAAQKMNQTSSRSHLIIMFNIRQEFIDPYHKKTQLFSQLSLIDLAGSERVRKTISSGLRLEEAKSINSSLNALGNVITALRSTSKPFIPYRASKLTRILQNALSGDAKIALIATISKCPSNVNETISTLQFASRCREVQLKPQINHIEEFETEEEEVGRGRGYMDQGESSIESENSIRGFNYDSGSLQDRNESLRSMNKVNEKLEEAYMKHSKEYLEFLEYMLKLLPNLKRFLGDKIPEIFIVRENFMSEMLEELRKKLETVKGNMSKREAQAYLKRHDFLEELDKRYPRYPEELPAEEEDKSDMSLLTQSPESVLENIQKIAKYLIDGINALANNSLNFERLKLDMLEKEMKESEKDYQIEQFSKLLEKVLKNNKELYKENIELRYQNLSSPDKLRLFNEYNQELVSLVRSYLGENGGTLQEKIVNTLVPSTEGKRQVIEKSYAKAGPQSSFENFKIGQIRGDQNNTILTSLSINPREDRSTRWSISKELGQLDSANISGHNLTANSSKGANANKAHEPDPAISLLQNLKLEVIEEAVRETVEDKKPHRVMSQGRMPEKMESKASEGSLYINERGLKQQKGTNPSFEPKHRYFIPQVVGINERVDTVNYLDSGMRSLPSPTKKEMPPLGKFDPKKDGNKENFIVPSESGGIEVKSEGLKSILRRNTLPEEVLQSDEEGEGASKVLFDDKIKGLGNLVINKMKGNISANVAYTQGTESSDSARMASIDSRSLAHKEYSSRNKDDQQGSINITSEESRGTNKDKTTTEDGDFKSEKVILKAKDNKQAKVVDHIRAKSFGIFAEDNSRTAVQAKGSLGELKDNEKNLQKQFGSNDKIKGKLKDDQGPKDQRLFPERETFENEWENETNTQRSHPISYRDRQRETLQNMIGKNVKQGQLPVVQKNIKQETEKVIVEEDSFHQNKDKSLEDLQEQELSNEEFSKDSEEGMKFAVNESFRQDRWYKNMKQDIFDSFSKKPSQGLMQELSARDAKIKQQTEGAIGAKGMKPDQTEKGSQDLYVHEQKKAIPKDFLPLQQREFESKDKNQLKKMIEETPKEVRNIGSGHKYQSSGNIRFGETSDQKTDKISCDHNYFSLSVREAQSILKDDLTEPTANPSPANNVQPGSDIKEEGQGEEYWSFSKKEVQEMKTVMPESNFEGSLGQRRENKIISDFNKIETGAKSTEEIQTREAGFGSLGKEGNIPSLGLIKNLNEAKEEPFVATQRKDVSPNTNTSRNFSFESLCSHRIASAQELPHFQKPNLNRLKDITKKSTQNIKSFRGRGHSHNNSMVDNMSLHDLSVSLERVNPKKYEDATSTSMLEKTEGLADKSFEEALPSNIRKVYDEKKGKDSYIGYLMDSYKSRKKSPIDQYKLNDKTIEFNSKPILPKMTKVVGNVNLSREKSDPLRQKNGNITEEKSLNLKADINKLKGLIDSKGKDRGLIGNSGN